MTSTRPTSSPAIDRHRLTDEQKADLIRRADLDQAVTVDGKVLLGGHLVRQALGVHDQAADRLAEVDRQTAAALERRDQAIAEHDRFRGQLEQAITAEREARDRFLASVAAWTDVHASWRTWITTLRRCDALRQNGADVNRAIRQDATLLAARGHQNPGVPELPRVPSLAHNRPTFAQALDLADSLLPAADR